MRAQVYWLRRASGIPFALAASAALGLAGGVEQKFPDGVRARIASVQIGGDFEHAAEAKVEPSVHCDGSPCGWRLFDEFSFHPEPGDKSLYVWFRVTGLYDLWEALLLGDDGQAEGKACYEAITGAVSPSASIVGFRFASFPRNQQSMRIRLIRGGEWQKHKRSPSALEFVIPNPAPVTKPCAESPPVLRKEIEGTWIVLESLSTGTKFAGSGGANGLVSRVCFEANDGVGPSRRWGLRALRLEDSFGNVLDSNHASQVVKFDERGKLVVPLHAPLWLAGNPWTVTAEFVRVEELPSVQQVVLKALPVDPDAKRIDRRVERRIEIRAAEPPEAPVVATYHTACDQPGNLLRLALELESVPAGFHCGVLEVKDGAGNAVTRVFGFNDFEPQKKSNPRYLIDIPDTSKAVDITFGIQQIRKLDFRSCAVIAADAQ